MGLFDKRVTFKPFEYPEVVPFKDAIRHSYWLHTEWSFTSDVHDFKKLSQPEQNALKNALLAISQIEISVKRFWTDLGKRFPKAEFEQVGTTFGESEVRHADAYSHLIEVLSLNNDFKTLMDVPVIRDRVSYLTKYLLGASDAPNEVYSLTLALFSIFVENVSLFSQFVVIKSFNQYRNILKDIDNVVQATQKEEQIHALFGVKLIGLIRDEHPEWFDAEFYEKLRAACLKSYEAEAAIIHWIFEKGDLPFLTEVTLLEFTKNRFNESLQLIGADPIFSVDTNELAKVKWFNDEIHSEVNTDFFHKRPVTYSKKTQACTADDLF